MELPRRFYHKILIRSVLRRLFQVGHVELLHYFNDDMINLFI